ncbi:hypothetical protein GOQ29_06960 [Clostridium sp. D2Q-14]|uniref:hypothetical protein n=1 Tax=Anaeromonas gelatinilytica TaxID=2683194 RepID=UPI00193C0152|nr:hypothetical protein [Anaeromonas gelatinilytica]MBS4535356.1 hypothetical protein [Anaeromonas gelatinilytica]
MNRKEILLDLYKTKDDLDLKYQELFFEVFSKHINELDLSHDDYQNLLNNFKELLLLINQYSTDLVNQYFNCITKIID